MKEKQILDWYLCLVMVRTNRTINPPVPPPPFSHKNTKTEQKKPKKQKQKQNHKQNHTFLGLSAQIVPPRTTPLYTRRSDFVRTPENLIPAINKADYILTGCSAGYYIRLVIFYWQDAVSSTIPVCVLKK